TLRSSSPSVPTVQKSSSFRDVRFTRVYLYRLSNSRTAGRQSLVSCAGALTAVGRVRGCQTAWPSEAGRGRGRRGRRESGRDPWRSASERDHHWYRTSWMAERLPLCFYGL